MRTRLLLATALVALVASRADAALLLNEIAYNPPSNDGPNEYVELRNPDAAALTVAAGTYLVAIEGDNVGNGAGDVQTIFNLSGLTVPASGFLVLAQKGNAYTFAAGATVVTGTGTGFGGAAGFLADSGTDIENASASFLLIHTATAPTLADDIDANNDGIPDGTVYAGWTILDSVANLDADATDRTYAAITFAKTNGATGTNIVTIPFDAGYLARAGNSTGSTAADWIVAEILGTAPTFNLSALGTPARTIPLALAGLPLDHIGSANFLNHAPVITAPAAFTIPEDGTQSFTTALNPITIADPDALTNLETLTVTASSGTVTLADPVDPLMMLTVTAGANGTSTVSITGTLVQLNAALDGLVYATGANANGTATVTLTVNDGGSTGVGSAQTDTTTITFTIDAVNDAPVVTVPTMQTVLTSGTLAFSTAMGNAISVTDVDLGTSTAITTVSVSAGTIALTLAGGATAGTTTPTAVTFTATATATNATLQSLVFTAPATATTATLTVAMNDQGMAGSGGAMTGTGTVMINVGSAPVFTAPAGPVTFTTSLGGHSPAQMVEVMAGGATGMITATAPAAFQLSAMAMGSYGASVMLPAAGGTLFVRYAPTTGTSHTGNLTYTTPGITQAATTALSGDVFRITTMALPDAMVGTAYTATVTAAGGIQPVTFTLMNPPSWLSISAAGVLSGTPDVDSDPSIMIVATDGQSPGQITSITLPLTVTGTTVVDGGIDAPIDAAEDAGIDAMGPDSSMPRPDAPGSLGGNVDDNGGCCGTSRPAGSSLLGVFVLGGLLIRRRRSRTAHTS